ncbi:sugar transferase [Peribacillus frigoritolerans]
MNIYPMIKRFFDLTLSITSFVLLWPFFLIIAIIIKLDSKGPVFFKQKRVGKNKKHFYIIKFRTMRIDTPKNQPTHMLSDPDFYITGVGRILRKTSLDELPQLLNIIKNDMSIIGPRPALWNQYDLIDEREKYGANGIIPGLTGWAQINGRDELSIGIKARLDGEYVSRMNFTFDVIIFLKTIFSVYRGVGIKEGKEKKSERKIKKTI